MLEDNIKLRNKAESKFQSFFDREINKLRNDFRNETEVRLLFSLASGATLHFSICSIGS
jgi:hypothetical protein